MIVTMRPVVLLVCVSVVLPVLTAAMEDVQVMQILDMEDQWTQWKIQHGKVYTAKEEQYRRQVFHNNLQSVLSHNAQYPLTVSFYTGLNVFSDMTIEEYRLYNRLEPRTKNSNAASVCRPQKVPGKPDLPATVDWRTKGYVTGIKDQGQCGSCWAFSTTGSVEGQHFNKTGTLLSLSEQQLVDCSGEQGNLGCEGGTMDRAFQYIMSQPHGLMTETDYPYQAANLGNCFVNFSMEQAPIKGCVDVTPQDEHALQVATATVGPISVAIDASHPSFKAYAGGVYYEPACSHTAIDHGVLVVGYGTFQGADYWLVKNSWGEGWGLNGYIMMSRNKDNNCAIATMGSYPLV